MKKMTGTEAVIVDDFLDPEDFKKLVEYFTLNDQLMFRRVAKALEYDNKIEVKDCIYKEEPIQQFSTSLIDMEPIQAVLDKLGIEDYQVLRCKINFTSPTEEKSVNGWHCDFFNMEEPHTTAVLYLNTNNGGTIFPDNMTVESMENRFVKFPGDTLHSGYSHTEEGERIVLNINYNEAGF